ncbi:LytR family transcriptional attenuator [Prauserella shujinwangii]|uniref:LytR family transcriptional attenuator n=2 Tax=Prauserella shujinwangii TaxID=1453103 RepID=A0A2T0LMX2_9PSEU|nr:LCP family protein [Prauserella shujinwangii]PRX44499.1 LytR family transcriptional attenuator [Prauserella shujinwangii]
MTDQLEPVDDATKYRRKIDESLARFSAAHDELEAEEQQRRQRRERLAARLEQTRTKLQRVVAATSQRLPKPQAGDDPGPGAAAVDVDQPTRQVPADAPPPRPALTRRDGADGAVGENGEEQADSPQTRLQEKKRRKERKALRAGRITAVIAAVLVFLATGTAWGTKTWFNAKFNEIAALDENSASIRDAPAQLGDENFLIVGSDTREGAEAEDNVGSTGGVPGARSDTMMLAHVPKDRSRAVVISFPRDLEIDRPACERWNPETGDYGEVVEADENVKINTSFAVGGPKCVTKVIQQISGMKINHFVGIDFQGFKGMVDAVGGVTVHVEEPMRDAELGMIVSQTGDVVLRGDQALNFVRARKVYSDPTFSDYGRMKRQQEFMSSLLKATLSRNVLLDMGKLTDFVNAFAASTFGENIGVDQMLTLAQSMRGLNAGSVTFLTVPTVGEANERGNEVLLDQQTSDLFHALINNAPLPGEEPETPASTGPKTSQQAAPA